MSNFNAQEGCFQVTFDNGILLSLSTRFVPDLDDEGNAATCEVRVWDSKGKEVEEWTGRRMDASEYLELAQLLERGYTSWTCHNTVV